MWLLRWGLGVDHWIYCTLYNHTGRDYRKYSAIAILHTFQITVTRALGLSVFTSRILSTDLSQSHCNFKSHMKSSFLNLIPILKSKSKTKGQSVSKSWCRTPFGAHDQIFIIVWQLRSCFVGRLSDERASDPLSFYNPSARTPRRTQSSIVKDAYLLVRYLAMDVLLLSRARVLRECVYRPVT
jgi:hypothetical protein